MMENLIPTISTAPTAPLVLLDGPLTQTEKQATMTQQDAPKTKTPIIPVPADAPACDFSIHDLGGKPTRLYPYHQADRALIGYIGRWDSTDPATGERKKTILPVTYCELPDGKRGWRSAGIPSPRPLYRLPEILARPDAPILICEGEKTAEAAQLLFPQYVATTPMHGAQSPGKTDFSPVKGRRVIISGDYDAAGQSFADAVYDLCTAAGASGIFDLPAEMLGKRIPTATGFDPNPDQLAQGYDLADALAVGWTEQTAQRLIDTVPLSPYVKASELRDMNGKLGSHFRLTRSGVEFANEKKDKDGNVTVDWVWVCSYLAITHQTRDTQGQNWGRVLVIIDNDGKRKECVLPMSHLAGDGVIYREELLSQGLRLSANGKPYLHMYITTANPKARATCVQKTGWHGDCYIVPERVYGQKSGERIVLQQTLPTKPRPLQGTLEDWQNGIGTLCVGNSRLVLAVCAALTGPLLEPLGEENFGFHVEGGSSIGKTTLLRVAASVWGAPIQSWRTTDNAAEGLARAANDGLLILDELSQVDGTAADAMAYMLGNGAGKARSRRDGTAKPPERFRLVFLSSGETGLAAKMQEGGKQPKAGQTVRFIELPADAGKGHGVFDDLHDLPDGNSLSQHLKHLAECNTGTVADAWLTLLCSNRTGLAVGIAKARKVWMDAHVATAGDGQVMRVGNKFALVAAVGELAIHAGILPWQEGEAENACLRLFNDWITRRGGTQAHESSEAEHRLRAFIAAHGSARFETPWEVNVTDDQRNRILNRAGFRRKTDDGAWEYFMLPEIFEREIIGSLNPTVAKQHLAAKGLILRDGQGKYTTSLRVKGHGQVRLYHIPATILSEEVSHGDASLL